MSQPTHPFDPLYGLSLPDLNWVPAPRYLMRRDRILNHLRETPSRGNLIEIGCGTGALLEDFRQLGFSCTGVEISEEALEIAKKVHVSNEDVRIRKNITESDVGFYDKLITCEVIEHIEDDLAALVHWTSLLKRGGELILSTPANPANFNALDEWAGHYRRYTQKSMGELCGKAGLKVVRFESYGYPLVDLTEKIRGWICKRQLRNQQDSDIQAATEKSGIDRSVESKLYPFLTSSIGRFLFKTALRIQVRYLDREIGNGMLCIAIKQ